MALPNSEWPGTTKYVSVSMVIYSCSNASAVELNTFRWQLYCHE